MNESKGATPLQAEKTGKEDRETVQRYAGLPEMNGFQNHWKIRKREVRLESKKGVTSSKPQ